MQILQFCSQAQTNNQNVQVNKNYNVKQITMHNTTTYFIGEYFHTWFTKLGIQSPECWIKISLWILIKLGLKKKQTSCNQAEWPSH